jgi:hypothetical protein
MLTSATIRKGGSYGHGMAATEHRVEFAGWRITWIVARDRGPEREGPAEMTSTCWEPLVIERCWAIWKQKWPSFSSDIRYNSSSGDNMVMNPEQLTDVATSDLLALYRGVLRELRRRRVVRSTNSPVADYAEYLVVKALSLGLAPKSTKGYDATDAQGQRYEIKGRRLTAHNRSRQLSVIRGLRERHFAYLAGVLFDERFSVLRACLLPIKIVEQEAVYREHVNGWILHLRDSLWELEGVDDITSAVRAAEADANVDGAA